MEQLKATEKDKISPSDAITPSNPPDISKDTNGAVDHASSYQIKPSLDEKFKETPVKSIINNVVSNILSGKSYEADSVKKWTVQIANEVNNKVKDLQMKKYKHIVNVVIGEMKGAGVKSGFRCIWDSDVDSFTSDVFMNDTIFCVTTVFAVYVY